jgi:hypothetical protein
MFETDAFSGWRGGIKKEGLTPLLDTPAMIIIMKGNEERKRGLRPS